MPVWEILLALAVGFGTALAVCLLPGRFFRPDAGGRRWVLIPGQGDGGALEWDVRAVLLLRTSGCIPVIADLGLDGQGREIALRLTRQWPEVVLWPGDRLEELLRQ